MGDNVIKIPRKDNVRGDDGYKTFSIRVKDEIVASLDELATKSNRSRNELISMVLEYAVENVEITEA